MIGSKLKDLMKVNNIKNLAELEKELFECDIPISTVNLNKIYNNVSINKTFLENTIKLMMFFECNLEDIFMYES